MGNRGLRGPFRQPAFPRLALSYAVNEMGDWLGVVALSVLVFERTWSALASALLFIGTGALPALLTPITVARSERPPPRFALPTIYAGEAAAFGALALLASNFSLGAVVAVAAIDGALALTGRTLTRAVTAAMLEPEGELRAGNAVLNVAFTSAAAVGPALAGAVVALLGVQSALLLDAASFYVIAWILLTTSQLPEVDSEPGELQERVRAGWAYIKGRATLRRLLAFEAAAIVFFSAVIPIEVLYAKQTLGVGDTGYGLLLGSWGAGMVFGSIVFASLRRAPLPLLLLFSTMAIGAGYLGVAAAQALAVACAASVIGGAGNGVQWVATVSAVQELTASSMQARVIGTLESVASAAPGVGYVLGGAVAEALSPRAAFVFAGCGIFVIAGIAIPLLGTKWSEKRVEEEEIDAEDPIMVELIPAGPTGPIRERPIEFEPEVER